MIVNPLALATKGYVSNSLSIARAFNGDIDLTGVAPELLRFGEYLGLYSGLYQNIYKFSN